MQRDTRWFAVGIALMGGAGILGLVQADTTISTFDEFTSNALYASWATGTVESGPTSYSITATGYGSNWKYNPVDGSGNTTVELTVTLSGPPAASGFLGPIITLVDADGTSCDYAWYGQTLGQHVLTKAVDSPTRIGVPGSIVGLDLATLTHLHLQLDPGGFGTSGPYTVEWENLSLIGADVPPFEIIAQSFNPVTSELTLTWTSVPEGTYAVWQASDLAASFAPLETDIASQGDTTTATLTVPDEVAGFVRVVRQ